MDVLQSSSYGTKEKGTLLCFCIIAAGTTFLSAFTRCLSNLNAPDPLLYIDLVIRYLHGKIAS